MRKALQREPEISKLFIRLCVPVMPCRWRKSTREDLAQNVSHCPNKKCRHSSGRAEYLRTSSHRAGYQGGFLMGLDFQVCLQEVSLRERSCKHRAEKDVRLWWFLRNALVV